VAEVRLVSQRRAGAGLNSRAIEKQSCRRPRPGFGARRADAAQFMQAGRRGALEFWRATGTKPEATDPSWRCAPAHRDKQYAAARGSSNACAGDPKNRLSSTRGASVEQGNLKADAAPT